MNDDDAEYERLQAEAMRLMSPSVCRAMAAFCLRLAQSPGVTDKQIYDLALEAERWRQAAIAKDNR